MGGIPGVAVKAGLQVSIGCSTDRYQMWGGHLVCEGESANVI